ncbi:hypothetical protein pneo_cds_1002 [Pandoravirus neocaledonia]|uniref:Uncharacterized protein n=1 Tax=Pandoravirus neocaledonia TaxID=2107708 RepID=A0A2U7UDR0_9VIRU|nr:hypothetical protein pneo_cds_1002 [Pandoravirus neocaledonia]AVK76609.1 hypothetical protein pneo_cds_1002 [Pandoravirus neocaledonia]
MAAALLYNHHPLDTVYLAIMTCGDGRRDGDYDVHSASRAHICSYPAIHVAACSGVGLFIDLLYRRGAGTHGHLTARWEAAVAKAYTATARALDLDAFLVLRRHARTACDIDTLKATLCGAGVCEKDMPLWMRAAVTDSTFCRNCGRHGAVSTVARQARTADDVVGIQSMCPYCFHTR